MATQQFQTHPVEVTFLQQAPINLTKEAQFFTLPAARKYGTNPICCQTRPNSYKSKEKIRDSRYLDPVLEMNSFSIAQLGLLVIKRSNSKVIAINKKNRLKRKTHIKCLIKC